MFDLMSCVVPNLSSLPVLLPMEVDITPNADGLPGIAQLRDIVGAMMTIGLILSVLALIISAIVWGFGANSSNPYLAGRGKVGERHGILRYTGLITVTATTIEDLVAHVAALEQAAIQANCETRDSSPDNKPKPSPPQPYPSAGKFDELLQDRSLDYHSSMAYYASERAAELIGIPKSLDLGTKSTARASGGIQPFTLGGSRESIASHHATIEQRVHEFLRQEKRRNIAPSLHAAVEVTQLLDVVIENLEVGGMKFLRVPGTSYAEDGTKENVRAFWAFGTEKCPTFSDTRLVLVGSLDNLTGKRYTQDDAAYDSYSFPSDPSFMIEILNAELELDVDLEDYSYETEWEPTDSTNGSAARNARETTERARNGAPGGRTTWVQQELPRQRVIAIVSDIEVLNDGSRTILARPVCISATV